MRILAIDSSGLVASVAVAEDERLLGEYTIDNRMTHSESLLPMIAAILDMLNMSVSDMDAIAVASGPGSFTGLRIGAATAKGLAFADELPIIPVPTLDALAYNQWGADGIICPLMDARRQQVYTGLFRFDRDGNLSVIRPACVVPIDDIVCDINDIGEQVTFLGDGVPIARDCIEETCRVHFSFAPLNGNRQHASAVAALGMRMFTEGKAVAADAFVPEYMRMSQAERERIANSDIFVRNAEHLDEPVLAELSVATMTDAWNEKAFSEAIDNENAFVIVSCEKRREILCDEDKGDASLVANDSDDVDSYGTSDTIIGYAVFYTAADEAEMPQIAIDENFRRAHIATDMLNAACRRLKDKGILSLYLEVRESNLSAIRFYENNHFEKNGIRKDFYESKSGTGREDAILYRRIL